MFKRFLKGMLGIAVMSLTLASCEKSPNEVVETLTVKPEEAISFNAKDNSDVFLPSPQTLTHGKQLQQQSGSCSLRTWRKELSA